MRTLDNIPDFIVIYLPIIIATITGIIGTGLGIHNFVQGQRDRRPVFSEFQRKQDGVGAWYIFVHSPTKPVRRCNAIFKGQQLQLRNEKGYEQTVPLGGGCNFDMPSGVSDHDDNFVIIRDGKKNIEKEKFSKMITVGI
ncbi:MAG: hypothetical protein HZA84_03655 [Thaumarchaeota archaeon]|nr:hypothetical protein [Nitrososphaerota archaeon]